MALSPHETEYYINMAKTLELVSNGNNGRLRRIRFDRKGFRKDILLGLQVKSQFDSNLLVHL